MKYLHTMVRVENLEASLIFYVNQLGLRESDRIVNEKGRFTLVFLSATGRRLGPSRAHLQLGSRNLKGGRNFGHLAYRVDDIYATCARLMAAGVIINRPPRDGRMRSFESPTKSRSSCCRRGMHCRLQSPGFRCRTAANGDASDLIAGYRRQAVLLLAAALRGAMVEPARAQAGAARSCRARSRNTLEAAHCGTFT